MNLLRRFRYVASFVRHDFVFFMPNANGVTCNPCKYVHGILACDQYTIVNNHRSEYVDKLVFKTLMEIRIFVIGTLYWRQDALYVLLL